LRFEISLAGNEFAVQPVMVPDPRQSRITLLLFIAIIVSGQVWLHIHRPIYPDPSVFPEKWPPAGSLVDATAVENMALEVYSPGTTVGSAIGQLGLIPDRVGSGFCLPGAGVLFRVKTGWRIRPMTQLERFIWRIPMQISGCEPEDLRRIRGIGPALARKIYNCVQERGHLESMDELGEIPGIGPKKLAALKRELTIY